MYISNFSLIWVFFRPAHHWKYWFPQRWQFRNRLWRTFSEGTKCQMLKKGRIAHEINDWWNEKMKSFTPIMGPRAHLFKDFLRVLRYNYSTTNVLHFLGASRGVSKHNFVNWLAQLPKSQPGRPLSSYPPFKRLSISLISPSWSMNLKILFRN